MEKSVPLLQVVLQYGVSKSALESWVRLVRANDYNALYKQKKRRRPSTSMGRPKNKNLKRN